MNKKEKNELIKEVSYMDDDKWYKRGNIFGSGKWWKESIVALIQINEKEQRFLLWGKS